MRGAVIWGPAAVAAVFIGLMAWGKIEARAAARPWSMCKDPDPSLTPAQQLAACETAMAARRVPTREVPRAHAIRGGLHLEAKDYARALGDFDRSLAMQPDDPRWLNNGCWARAVAGRDLDRARQQCDRAVTLWIEASAEYAEALDSRGLVGLKQGRFAEAHADYDLAVKARPDSFHYRYGRGVAALRLGRIEEGRADLAEAGKYGDAMRRAYESYGVRP